jgi:GNAT superfamily N-acetyltransferase
MRIELLADQPLAVPVVSAWHFNEWGGSHPGALAAWTAGLAARCERDRIPITFVAMVGSEPVGSVSLVVCDMDTRRDLSPWLGSVYVLPAFRRRGIATGLVTHALAQARRLGVQRLYLWTDSAASLYERLGWHVLCEELYRGKNALLMVCDPGAGPEGATHGING